MNNFKRDSSYSACFVIGLGDPISPHGFALRQSAFESSGEHFESPWAEEVYNA